MLIIIAVVMIAQVVSRYVFNASLSWSDELCRYMLVWSCFLSVSYCVKRRISIKIEQLQNALPKRAIPWMRLVRHTIVFIFCIIMIPYAWRYLQYTIASGATSSAMQIPMYWIQSAPFVGFILLTIRVAQAWVREFKISVLHYPDVPKSVSQDFHKSEFPKADEPGEIWVQTQLTSEDEYKARESLGTLRKKNANTAGQKSSENANHSKKTGGNESNNSKTGDSGNRNSKTGSNKKQNKKGGKK